jgi:hypothetical protein
MATVTIMIPPNGGSPIVSVQGHAGPGCKALTAKLEAKLGCVVSDVETPEMYEIPLTAQERERVTE